MSDKMSRCQCRMSHQGHGAAPIARFLTACYRTYIYNNLIHKSGYLCHSLKKSWNRESRNNLISSDVAVFSPPPDALLHPVGGSLEASPSNFWLRLKEF